MDSSDVAVLLLRTCFGLSMAWHGINKTRGPRGIAGTAAWFASIGMRRPRLNARLASLTEIAAGVSFAVGFLTPLAAAAIVGLMTVAIVTVHWRVGYFVFLPDQGWEYCFAIAVVAGVTPLFGADRASVDSVVGSDLFVGSPWTWLTVPLGIGVALCQLSLFWRPERGATSS